MYRFKENIVNVYNQSAIAREVGLSIETVNRIFNRKQNCSKTTALCICKIIYAESEIDDFFELVKEEE